MKLYLRFVVTTCFIFINGCSITSLPTSVKKSLGSVNSGIDAANNSISQAKSIRLSKDSEFNQDISGIYLSDTVLQRKDTEFLPPIFASDVQIDSYFISMRQIADAINKLSTYPVLLNTDSIADIKVRLTQNTGNLVDLLNTICAKTDTAWKFEDGKILISDTQTKTWFLHALPGDVAVQNQVNSNSGIQGQSGGDGASASGGSMGQQGGSNGGAGGMSTGQSQVNSNQTAIQNVQYNLANSFWGNLSATLKTMLSKRGRVNIMPSTSSITVTDKPSVILAVDDFIAKQNDSLKRQVQIDVQVLSVDTSAADNYGINWDLVLQGRAASLLINGQPPAGGVVSGGSANQLSPVFTPSNTTQSFTVSANSGDLNGSQLIIDALSTVAKASLVTSTAATTLNNQPVPVQIVEQQSFVSNVTNTMVPFAGNQMSITTGQISYGFVLNILPNIEENGLVNLQISMNLSSLKGLNNFAVSGAMVQLPDMLQRNTMQKVTLHSNDTYVLTGFDSNFNQIVNSGVGGVSNWWLGGGVSAQKNRTRLIILVTPRVINVD